MCVLSPQYVYASQSYCTIVTLIFSIPKSKAHLHCDIIVRTVHALKRRYVAGHLISDLCERVSSLIPYHSP